MSGLITKLSSFWAPASLTAVQLASHYTVISPDTAACLISEEPLSQLWAVSHHTLKHYPYSPPFVGRWASGVGGGRGGIQKSQSMSRDCSNLCKLQTAKGREPLTVGRRATGCDVTGGLDAEEWLSSADVPLKCARKNNSLLSLTLSLREMQMRAESVCVNVCVCACVCARACARLYS